MAKAKTVTHKYILCPSCNAPDSETRADHLPEGFRSLWYCHNKECRVRYSIEMKDGEIFVEPTGEIGGANLALLKRGNLWLLVDGIADDAFYYNEHTCPTNYLGSVIEVYDEDEGLDPHGCFEFVEAIPRPKGFDSHEHDLGSLGFASAPWSKKD